MTKNNRKKIATVIGATTIGGALAVTAVAQACTGDSPSPATARSTEFANAINEFTNYNSSTSTITSSLAMELLTAMNSQANGESMGSTLTTIVFNSIVASSVSVSNNSSTFAITISNVTGTISDEMLVITGSMVVTATVNSEGDLAIAADTGTVLNFSKAPIELFLDAINSPLVRQWTDSDAVVEGTFQANFLARIFALTSMTGITNAMVQSFGFDAVEISNINITGSGEQTQYNVSFRNALGLGMGELNQNFSIMGEGSNFEFTCVFSNVLTLDANNIQVAQPMGLSVVG